MSVDTGDAGIRVVCPICGKDFLADSMRRKYCSLECKSVADRAARRRWGHRNYEKRPAAAAARTAACAECGGEFRTKAAKGRKYCSLECLNAAESRIGNGFCKRCGREMTTRRIGQKYCSMVCGCEAGDERRILWLKAKRAAKKMEMAEGAAQ